MADYYFASAVSLRARDLNSPSDLRLLVRNCQKRLFIGIGTELLLKAIYLKHGFLSNKPETCQAAVLSFPFTPQQAGNVTLAPDTAFMLNDLIDGLRHVPAVGSVATMDRGLRIAKVFRNKEGHVVLSAHKFDRQTTETWREPSLRCTRRLLDRLSGFAFRSRAARKVSGTYAGKDANV